MTIQVGDRLPDLTLTTMTEEGPKPIGMTEFCAGKKVVIFAVPGAFTPTCSAQHLPGFIDNKQMLSDKGEVHVAHGEFFRAPLWPLAVPAHPRVAHP